MDLVGTGEGKSNNTKREGEEEEEEENNNTLNDYITGFRVLVLQHTRPFDAAISRGRPSVRLEKDGSNSKAFHTGNI